MKCIKEVDYNDFEEWLKLGLKLWPENSEDGLRKEFEEIFASLREKAFLYKNGNEYIGFVNVSIRNDYVEGSDSSPVGYVEGIYVVSQHRKSGIAKLLLRRGEKWAKDSGCKQMGSDIEYSNNVSYDFHKRVGFNEAGRIICFIKDIEE